MNTIVLSTLLALSAAVTPTHTAKDWTGVWQTTTQGKPSLTITLADDSGVLAGTIVFEGYDRETNSRIALEPRTLVNPHLEGNSLAFEVRSMPGPHQKDKSASESVQTSSTNEPADIVQMALVLDAEGNATLNCPKCGAPTEMKKEQ